MYTGRKLVLGCQRGFLHEQLNNKLAISHPIALVYMYICVCTFPCVYTLLQYIVVKNAVLLISCVNIICGLSSGPVCQLIVIIRQLSVGKKADF